MSATAAIRTATPSDFDTIQRIFRAVIGGGDTYAFGTSMSDAELRDYWLGPAVMAFVAVEGEDILGMYRLVPNQRERGAHVANASFMVAPAVQGRGLGRRMGLHCLDQARAAGFLAMQFNYVVASNAAAVALWQSLGFAIVGTLPGAFQHDRLGFVDVYVMYQVF
jgi:GNAT superfamily N-acetyltransferase